MTEQITNRIIEKLQQCAFIKAVVLGGSRATKTNTEASDIDIGIYYEKENIDFDMLNDIAKELDDTRRENLICPEGGWGKWVNCGGWLVINGLNVDLILRDIARVRECVDQTDSGSISSHYQPGHPHAFLNVMYRGELASCKVLYARDSDFTALKKQSEIYPDCLKDELTGFFMFEAGFSCMLAKAYSKNKDLYYIAGHLFRSISALNQVLFALNRTYCLNEKKAVLRINGFAAAPPDYSRRINKILSLTEENFTESISELESLCHEVEQLAGSKQP